MPLEDHNLATVMDNVKTQTVQMVTLSTLATSWTWKKGDKLRERERQRLPLIYDSERGYSEAK
eukprot:132699-Amphidinium_carterae.2